MAQIDIDILPEEGMRELLDFYEYILNRYGKKRLRDKKTFFESVGQHMVKLPKDYIFDREELHER